MLAPSIVRKSTPCRSTVAPVGRLPRKGPEFVPRIRHCSATVPDVGPVSWLATVSNVTSGKASNRAVACAAIA
jgi:hypothetical protein